MFAVYVLRSQKTGKRYVGSTGQLEKRLETHNRGKVRATKGSRPWVLVYREEFATNAEARKREASLKTGKGRAELDRLLGIGGSTP